MGDPGGSSGYDELDPVQAEQNIDAFISHANDLDGPTVQAIASEVAALVPSCRLDDDERTDRNLGRLASGISLYASNRGASLQVPAQAGRSSNGGPSHA